MSDNPMQDLQEISEILAALKTILPGERVIYYVGNIGDKSPVVGGIVTSQLAWALYEKGLVHLTQQRLGPPVNQFGRIDWHGGRGPGFKYIATGASKGGKPPTFESHLRSMKEPA